VLLPGYREQQVRKSGLLDIFDKDLVATLPGGHDAVGKECQALDGSLTRTTIQRLMGRVSAFAVSSMFGVRNPAHELRVRVRNRSPVAMNWPVTWTPRAGR
jgi:N-methylhydantoinase A/oxoprolinase/acetone carboxylase beta subunit